MANRDTNNTQNQETQNQEDPTQTQENTPQNTEELPAVTQVTGKTYTEEQVQAIHQLYGGALQEKEGELNSLRQNTRTQETQQHNPEQDSQMLMTDPRKLIREEIQASIAPLAQGLNEFRAMSVYDNLKTQFKVHPNYARHFEVPGFEGYLDQIMQGVQQVSIPVLQDAITRVIGFMVTNNLYTPLNTQETRQVPINQPNNNPPRQQNNQPNGNMNLPAHLRSSGAPAPGGSNNNLTPNGNPRRPLSENEKRVARERKMSDDDYLDWLVVPMTGVVQSKIGVKK